MTKISGHPITLFPPPPKVSSNLKGANASKKVLCTLWTVDKYHFLSFDMSVLHSLETNRLQEGQTHRRTNKQNTFNS